VFSPVGCNPENILANPRAIDDGVRGFKFE
jgi:hypothetical protein